MQVPSGQQYLISLELDFQKVVRLLLWVLGIKLVICKNSMYACLLHHLSSPRTFYFWYSEATRKKKS